MCIVYYNIFIYFKIKKIVYQVYSGRTEDKDSSGYWMLQDNMVSNRLVPLENLLERAREYRYVVRMVILISTLWPKWR